MYIHIYIYIGTYYTRWKHLAKVINEIRWEEEILHRKYDKSKPKIYDLMTECIECIEYIKHIGHIEFILDILYIQETHVL